MGDESRGAPVRSACAGVVLAGGRSSRMGCDKTALSIAGEPLLRRVVGRLRLALSDVVVVGPEVLHSLVPGVRILHDDAPGSGPLGALATALRALPAERVFLTGCDMPFVTPGLVLVMARLAAQCPDVDVVLPRSPTGPEYLHAVYSRSCLPAIERLLSQGERSLRSLVDGVSVRDVAPELVAFHDPHGHSAFNANTPEEWQWALSIAEAENEREGASRGWDERSG